MRQFVKAGSCDSEKVEKEARMSEKILLTTLLFALASLGYFIVGILTSEPRARSLHTSFDDLIPFLPQTSYLYACAYTIIFYPAFIIRCQCLFRCFILAIGIMTTACFACWVAFPVASTSFRIDLNQISRSTFYGWGIWLVYTLDPPVNLFPSLHVAGAVMVGLVAKQVRAAYCWVIMPMIVGICVSTFTIKQHYLIDGLAGILISLVVWWIVVRPIRTASYPAKRLATSWKGPVAYLIFHTIVYAAIYTAFQAGWAPWEKHSSLSNHDRIRVAVMVHPTSVEGELGADKQKGGTTPILWLSVGDESACAARRRPLLCFLASRETISVLQISTDISHSPFFNLFGHSKGL